MTWTRNCADSGILKTNKQNRLGEAKERLSYLKDNSVEIYKTIKGRKFRRLKTVFRINGIP